MGVYRYVVALGFTAGAQHGTNTWHIRTENDTTERDSNLNAMIAALGTFYTSVKAYLPTSYTITGPTEATEVGTVDPEAVAGLTGFSLAGTGGTGYSPAPVMACITWRSSKASRRGRGRTFIGPLGTGAVQTDGTLDNTFRTSLLSAASNLISTSLADGNGALAVWSSVDQLARDFTSATVTDQAAVLRSRRG